MSSLVPSFLEERRYHALGYRNVAGVDEVGRGALAGPVVAAAVILPPCISEPWLDDVRDSKLLDPVHRELLFSRISEGALATAVGSVSSEIIDSIGIVKATEMAMIMAIGQLSPAPQAVLVDFFRLPSLNFPQKGVPDGDSLCLSIACASIIAKVTRDRIMVELDKAYPGYGLAGHKGYGTGEHIAFLSRFGPSPIHRRSFNPVRQAQGRPVRELEK
ncbi:MAG: ribonuclease HII [Chloroflexi bacterium]|nr:ribonuclease HII [Chloroflexota bacterium]